MGPDRQEASRTLAALTSPVLTASSRRRASAWIRVGERTIRSRSRWWAGAGRRTPAGAGRRAGSRRVRRSTHRRHRASPMRRRRRSQRAARAVLVGGGQRVEDREAPGIDVGLAIGRGRGRRAPRVWPGAGDQVAADEPVAGCHDWIVVRRRGPDQWDGRRLRPRQPVTTRSTIAGDTVPRTLALPGSGQHDGALRGQGTDWYGASASRATTASRCIRSRGPSPPPRRSRSRPPSSRTQGGGAIAVAVQGHRPAGRRPQDAARQAHTAAADTIPLERRHRPAPERTRIANRRGSTSWRPAHPDQRPGPERVDPAAGRDGRRPARRPASRPCAHVPDGTAATNAPAGRPRSLRSRCPTKNGLTASWGQRISTTTVLHGLCRTKPRPTSGPSAQTRNAEPTAEPLRSSGRARRPRPGAVEGEEGARPGPAAILHGERSPASPPGQPAPIIDSGDSLWSRAPADGADRHAVTEPSTRIRAPTPRASDAGHRAPAERRVACGSPPSPPSIVAAKGCAPWPPRLLHRPEGAVRRNSTMAQEASRLS